MFDRPIPTSMFKDIYICIRIIYKYTVYISKMFIVENQSPKSDPAITQVQASATSAGPRPNEIQSSRQY